MDDDKTPDAARAKSRERTARNPAVRSKANPAPHAAPMTAEGSAGPEIRLSVRRIHRRDLNRVWDFLKKTFRDVNRETVEYQRPRLKSYFLEIYEDESVVQLLFELHAGRRTELVGYAECASQLAGADNWMNPRYFESREMRPLFVEVLAVDPEHHGLGIGTFILEQLEHLARVRACTHLVLEAAENNERALRFYRKRSFQKIDAAVFLAKKVATESELLPPRTIKPAAKP